MHLIAIINKFFSIMTYILFNLILLISKTYMEIVSFESINTAT